MNIIAIDCGASFIKASRMNSENRNIECIENCKTPGRSRDTLRIENTISLVRELIDKMSVPGEEIHIGFSTEMHGFVLADKEGHAITDYISWQDESGYELYGEKSYVNYIKDILSKEDVLKTGMPIKAGLPNVNLFYQLENKLEDYQRGDLYFYTLGDYIIRVLSEKEPKMHVTNAAATGLFDIVESKWNKGILQKLGMEEINFPGVIDTNETMECSIDGRIIFFYPALGDQQAALWGSELEDEETVSLNFGTGAQVSVLSNNIILSENYQTRPYFNNMYLCTVPHIPSGRALNVYFNFVKQCIVEFSDVDDDSIWEYILRQAKEIEFPSLEIDMSFFSNAISLKTRGYIDNIEEDTFTLGNLFSSLFRTMSVNAKKAFERLENKDVDKIIFSGGVVRKNCLLRTMMMQEFKIKESIVSENETLFGIYRFIRG